VAEKSNLSLVMTADRSRFSSQAEKLVLGEKVVALTFGGESGAQFDAVADVAEKYKVPYVAIGGMSNMASRKYVVETAGWEALLSNSANM